MTRFFEKKERVQAAVLELRAQFMEVGPRVCDSQRRETEKDFETAQHPSTDNVAAGHKPALRKNSTLADLYDPVSMPAVLAKAHAELDRAVDRSAKKPVYL